MSPEIRKTIPSRKAALPSISDAELVVMKVVWGRAPGSGHPGELTAVQKIGRLRKYLDEFGGYAQPRGPYEIDIRHWQEITRRPLNPRQIGAAYEERIRLR